MRKKLLYLPFLLLPVNLMFSQTSEVFHTGNYTASTIQVISSDDDETILEFRMGTVYSREISGQGRIFMLDKGQPLQQKFMPDLPGISGSVIIPDEAEMTIDPIGSVYTEYANVDVAPSRGVISRNIDPGTLSYEKGSIYQSDALFPETTSALREPYVLRDFRAQTVVFYPLQYNPVTKTLRIYNTIRITIKTTGETGMNPLVRTASGNSIEKEFHTLYGNHFLNYENTSRYAAVEENGSMLIICHDAFTGAMQPYIDWKTQRGLPVEMVNTSVTGTSSAAIKSYVQNYYAAHPSLKYLLLVGDAPQIPPQDPDGSNGLAGPSDNFYGYLAGNDHYPEIFVGRFSAESETDVITQVQRSIDYEKNPGNTGAYGKGTTIGSDQGPGDDNEMDFEHERVIRNKLLAFTYTEADEFYDGSQGGVDASGNPTPSMVVNALNDGRGIITYTGHGWNGGCASSNLSSTDVAGLQNMGMLPFFWSVACVNGEFMNTTCFAEYCLRSVDAGTHQPVGMVATLMSTINQYWNEPMEGQDEMVDLLTEAHASNIKRTFGGLSMNGCMKMNDSYGSSGMDMTDTWTCFGDPSLLVRTRQAGIMTTTHITSSPTGITSLLVNCNVEDAFISLSANGQILGTGSVSGGAVNISFPAIMNPDTIIVTATAFNYVPYQGKVEINDSYAGIGENEDNTLSIYPNPAGHTATIQLNGTGDAACTYTICDMGGKVLYSSTPLSLSGTVYQTIEVGGWAGGTYILKLNINGKITTYPLIVNH